MQDKGKSMKMLKTFMQRLRGDRGDSTLVSTIIVIPLILASLITLIDLSLYFNNRSFIVNATRDSARTVAIFGGDGTPTASTPLEYAYGDAGICGTSIAGNPILSEVRDFSTNYSAIECQLMLNLGSAALVNVKVAHVECGPTKSTFIGMQTWCAVAWRYDGIPASAFSLIRSAGNNRFTTAEAPILNPQGFEGLQYTQATASTEVNLSGINCQARSNGAPVGC